MTTITAAGTVPWRITDGRLEVALVHRPRYDDWSWSKGKLEPAEPWPVAAVRETLEETGLQVRLGLPLPLTTYRVLDRLGRPATKYVRYWAAEVVGGDGRLEHEIDAVEWLDVAAAHDRLDYAHDREQLRALQRADLAGTLATRPLAVVRHALALPRASWSGRDTERPLTAIGEHQAACVADVLAAYGVRRLVTSPSRRCVATLLPYAAARGVRLRTREGLSEEGFAARGAARVVRAVKKLLDGGTPAAVCSHGPVLPSVLETVRARVPGDASEPREALAEALDLGLDKGEVLVAHVSGHGRRSRVRAVERVAT